MNRVTVPLYQKVIEEKQEVEKVAGELLLTDNQAEVTYNYTRKGSEMPLTISDFCDTDSLNQCRQTSQLWMTQNRIISVNCKDQLVSIEFAYELKPVYLYYHGNELEDAIDVLLEPRFA